MLHRTLQTKLRALVGVKRVIDYTVKIRVGANGVVTDGVRHSANPFDENAIEAAVQMKEKKIVNEIVAVTIGGPKSVEVLRGSALALGCDKAIHVKLDSDDTQLEPLLVAKALQKIAGEVEADMILLGKQAIDDDCCQTPQLLAGLMDAPQATWVSSMEIADDKKSVTITRELDDGLQKLQVPLPAVFSTDYRLNEPRFPTLPNIMKAKKKPLQEKTLADLGITDTTPRIKVKAVSEPPKRAAGVTVKSVDELVDKLKNEAKCI